MTLPISEDLAVLQAFRSLLPGYDCVEELELSRLHRIVLGVISWDLTEGLGISTVADINTVDVRGRSALSWAVIKGDHGAVKMLLESGADINICNHDGDTALLHAAERHDTTCMGLLLNANADKAHRNKVRHEDAMYKAIRNKKEDDPGFIQFLLDVGFSIESKGNNGVSALALATKYNHWISVNILIGNGADLESADDDGDTPLRESLFLHSDDSLKFLLEAGADYTKIDGCGDPIVHDVAIFGGLRTVEIVHATKSDARNIKSTNKQGKTALELAQERDRNRRDSWKCFSSCWMASLLRNPGGPNNAAALATSVIWYSRPTMTGMTLVRYFLMHWKNSARTPLQNEHSPNCSRGRSEYDGMTNTK